MFAYADTRPTVILRDWNRCALCWSTVRIQVHHRLPRGMGGTTGLDVHQPANLITLCDGCHRGIESYRVAALERGHLIEHAAIFRPDLIPVVRDCGTYWVLQTNGGTLMSVCPKDQLTPTWQDALMAAVDQGLIDGTEPDVGELL